MAATHRTFSREEGNGVYNLLLSCTELQIVDTSAALPQASASHSLEAQVGEVAGVTGELVDVDVPADARDVACTRTAGA